MGGAGGYGHIVFDDDNYDCVSSCLEYCYKSKYADSLSEQVRLASLKALTLIEDMQEDDIETIVVVAFEIMNKGLTQVVNSIYFH